MRKICKPHLRHINKKWRQVKPKRKQDNSWTWLFFQKCPLWASNKKNTFIIGAWSFFLIHIRFTPSEGPKAFKTIFLRSQTMEVRPCPWTIEKGHLPWSDFMVYNVNMPLAYHPSWYSVWGDVWAWSLHILVFPSTTSWALTSFTLLLNLVRGIFCNFI